MFAHCEYINSTRLRKAKSLPMKTRSTLIALAAMLVVGFGTQANAQDDAAQLSYTPKHMWEVGLHGGFAFNSGDLDIAPGFGAGVHVRRAFDHIFSIRIDGQYVAVNSDAPSAAYPFSEFQGTSLGGSAQAVVTLNNFKFDKPVRKINLYAFAGPGAGLLSLKGTPTGGGAEVDIIETRNLTSIGFNAVAGGGISLRVSPKFNIGLEHKVIVPFGKTADLFDGFQNIGSTATSFRDIPNYTNLRFNFNIGDDSELSEPLYWVNPLNQVIDELTELKARPVLDLTDTDSDGIIDMLDQETDTPEGSPVDTRGVALDSDGDGVKDYEDAEPFSMPGLTVDSRGVAQAPAYMTQPQIEDLVNGKLAAYQRTEDARPSSMEDWFLPMIHFNLNSYTVRKADYGHLKNVAGVMRANPSVRVLVRGYTDKLASDDYNRVLSYNRAKAAKEYLVNRYGISPDRLVINYGGEDEVLVPTSTGNFMNRRVEFSIAKNETEMGMPSGPRAGQGTFFSGSRDAGY